MQDVVREFDLRPEFPQGGEEGLFGTETDDLEDLAAGHAVRIDGPSRQ